MGQCSWAVGPDQDVFWACAGNTTIPEDARRNAWLLQPHYGQEPGSGMLSLGQLWACT